MTTYTLVTIVIAAVTTAIFFVHNVVSDLHLKGIWVVGPLEDAVVYEIIRVYNEPSDLAKLKGPSGISHTVIICSLTPPSFDEKYIAKNKGGKRFLLVPV